VVSIVGSITVGLLVANEKRRCCVIMQNREIAKKAEQELSSLRLLGFIDRDMPVKSTYERLQAANAGIDLAHHKWWMISIKTEEKKSKEMKLKRLLSLNRKILKSYKHDLCDLRRFGFPENDPRVVYSRNRAAQTVVELANLTREYNDLVSQKELMTNDQRALLEQAIAQNQETIGGYKAQIERYLEKGLKSEDKKVCEIRSKMAAKWAENGLLERKLHR
jgi:hypothetical protein